MKQLQIEQAQKTLASMMEALLKEHARLQPLAENDKQSADEQVSVAAMLAAATRANRELVKLQHAFDWYEDHVCAKRKQD